MRVWRPCLIAVACWAVAKLQALWPAAVPILQKATASSKDARMSAPDALAALDAAAPKETCRVCLKPYSDTAPPLSPACRHRICTTCVFSRRCPPVCGVCDTAHNDTFTPDRALVRAM